MKSGKELAHALTKAMELKEVGATEVGTVFGVSQPSVSEWRRLGRIHKRHIPRLLSYFADVVGPDHWGLPFTQEEFDCILALRELPESARIRFITQAKQAAERAKAATEDLAAPAPAAQAKHRPRAA